MSDCDFIIEANPETITAFANTEFSRDVHMATPERFVTIRRTRAVQRVRDIKVRDGIAIRPDMGAASMTSAFEATPESAQRLLQRDRLISLVGQMRQDGYSCVLDRTTTISDESAEAAAALFGLLLPHHQAPKIAPDGEGALVALWEDRVNPTMLVIDNWKLHLVVGAATPNAQYFEDVAFDGELMPDVIAQAIPK